MSAVTNAAAPEVARLTPRRVSSRFWVKIADYLALTKPEISVLIAIATFTGFYLGRPAEDRGFPFLLVIHTLVGTVLVASGASTLNQYLERRFDAQMRRTRRRPLACGRLRPSGALCFGVTLSVTGAAYLGLATNRLAGLLAVLTIAAYLLLYTPLKRETPLCTLVGAIPGAVPPLIGCAAASGKLNVEAWGLYTILFLWQFPHFMAIAWMYREDYLRAGYLVLSRGEQAGRVMSCQALAPAFVLIPVSIGLTFTTGFNLPWASVAVGLLGAGFFYYSAGLAIRKSNAAARRLLGTSIIYLPLVHLLVVISKCCR
jgi:protoheme IX farnesyltransferase